MSKESRKVHNIVGKIKELESSAPEIPWEVWTTFCDSKPDYILHGANISFGGDFKTLKECRRSVEWLVDQLGGKVTWKNK